MKIIKLFLLTYIALLCHTANATTWNEPWADEVIKKSEYFVLANIKACDKSKGVTIEIIKVLGGKPLTGKIKITNFYLLDLCSGTEEEGPEFHLDTTKQCYFFLKKNEKGEYCIPTPTTGYDYIIKGNVYATYRHSYQKALVPVDVYEHTMTAIFNNYHNLPYDKKYITDYVSKYLSIKPAGFGESEINTFFAQHVALECIYHLKLEGYYAKIIPFLNDTANFHAQLSAAQALSAYNTPGCKEALLKVIADTTRNTFIQVICVWTLKGFKPKELKEKLVKINQTASTTVNRFGGDIMDPRVCTFIPSLRTALDQLIEQL